MFREAPWRPGVVMMLLLSFSVLLAFAWPIAGQDSLNPSQAPTPGTQPIGLTVVPLRPSTQRPTESQTVKGTASSESAHKGTLFVGTQNGEGIRRPEAAISHTKATPASSLAGPFSTGVRGGPASSHPPATEPLALGTSSLREQAIGLTESPRANQSPGPSTTQVSTEVEPMATEGPIQLPAEDVSPPGRSGDRVIVVSKTTADDAPVTVTISPLRPRKLTSTSTTLTKMAKAQPRPTSSVILRPMSTPASPKTSAPPADSQSAGDWEGPAVAMTTAAVSTGGSQPGESDKPNINMSVKILSHPGHGSHIVL